MNHCTFSTSSNSYSYLFFPVELRRINNFYICLYQSADPPHSVSMLATRTTSRSLARLQKSYGRFACKPSTPVPTVSGRSLYSNAYISSRLRPSTGISSPPHMLKTRLNGSSSVIQRGFSATAAVSHGHIDPPKPGEEYVAPQVLQPQKYILNLEQALHYIHRQGGRRAQDCCEQGRQPVDHCTGP